MKKVISIVLIFSSFALISSAKAQTVILINGEPTKVILDQSDIVEQLEDDVSNYLDGFDTSVPKAEKLLALETKVVSNQPSLSFVAVKESDDFKLQNDKK